MYPLKKIPIGVVAIVTRRVGAPSYRPKFKYTFGKWVSKKQREVHFTRIDCDGEDRLDILSDFTWDTVDTTLWDIKFQQKCDL